MSFDPADWYWRVGDDMRLWSSRSLAYVEEDDAAFLAWAAARETEARASGVEGDIPPVLLASPAQSLGEVEMRLGQLGLPATLADYVAARRWRAETGGVEIAGRRYATDRESQSKFTAAFVMASSESAASFNWKSEQGFVALDAVAMIALAQAVGAHVQACFDLEAALLAQIAAGGIETVAEIDAAGWPGGAA